MFEHSEIFMETIQSGQIWPNFHYEIHVTYMDVTWWLDMIKPVNEIYYEDVFMFAL